MLYFSLLIVTALWHTLAMYSFLVYPQRVLYALTRERPVSLIAMDVVQFLGALNGGYVAMAGWEAWQPHSAASVDVVLANGSQLIIDLMAQRSGRWTTKLLPITVMDGLLTVLFGVYVAQKPGGDCGLDVVLRMSDKSVVNYSNTRSVNRHLPLSWVRLFAR